MFMRNLSKIIPFFEKKKVCSADNSFMENSAPSGNPFFHQFHIAKDQCTCGKNMDGASPNLYKNILEVLTFFPFVLTLVS